ncbi:MAG: asparagine synthetase B family protein [Candidatus Electrothrix sp. YB6]
MGAIFGFSGWSGKKNRAMAAALSHRGIPPARTHASIRSTACWLPSRSHHGGIIEHCGQVIALAGRLFTDKKETRMAKLLRSYRDQGLDFVRNLHGAYVLAVLDEDRIHLARDPAGIRTIYYGFYNDRFIFAVEPKGVLAWSGFARNLRPAAVAQYFSFGFIPGRETMLENLWELPPGHTVTFANGRVEPPRCFFSVEEEEKEEKDEQAWMDEFVHIHEQAVRDQLPESGSVGLFFSGGPGSGIVSAEVIRQCGKKLPSWSIRVGDPPGNPHGQSRSVADLAEHIGSDHREISVQPKEFLARVQDVIHALNEPVADPSAVFEYMLSAAAAGEVEYVVNGAGASPVFGGADNIPILLRHWYGGIKQGRFFRERTYLSSCFGAYDELNNLLTPEWRSLYNSHEALEGILTPFFEAERPENFLDKLSAVNIRLRGGNMILPKTERMTGVHGLNSLSPLFDDRLIRLSFRMPSTLKLRQGTDKIILRQAYKNILPQEFADRQDSGLQLFRQSDFRRALRSYVRRFLGRREIKQAGIFNPDRVRELLNLPPEQTLPRHEQILWMLVTFEIWRRTVLREKT